MASKRKRKKPVTEEAVIPMTPMIDVVFQLLVYFIVTMKPMDVVAHLDVFRPSPEASQEKPDTPPKMIRISIYADGYTINDKPVTPEDLDRLIMKLSSFDKNQTILIMCTALSPHEKLVKVLDLCAKSGLKNLSVISTN
ncbi:MAG: biopolymer transporter ExbD [Spartobacteria bacterium]|nr:biopolymer transporter ExbD [Spartobacteria bacterium]